MKKRIAFLALQVLFITATIAQNNNGSVERTVQRVNNAINRGKSIIDVFQPYLLKARQLYGHVKQLTNEVKTSARNTKNNRGETVVVIITMQVPQEITITMRRITAEAIPIRILQQAILHPAAIHLRGYPLQMRHPAILQLAAIQHREALQQHPITRRWRNMGCTIIIHHSNINLSIMKLPLTRMAPETGAIKTAACTSIALMC